MRGRAWGTLAMTSPFLQLTDRLIVDRMTDYRMPWRPRGRLASTPTLLNSYSALLLLLFFLEDNSRFLSGGVKVARQTRESKMYVEKKTKKPTFANIWPTVVPISGANNHRENNNFIAAKRRKMSRVPKKNSRNADGERMHHSLSSFLMSSLLVIDIHFFQAVCASNGRCNFVYGSVFSR